MIELVPESYLSVLNLETTFGRAAPLQVDLGCGDGSFLCELAQRNPDRNFLGIDKLAGRVAKSCRKSAALENVRVLNVEISYAVRYFFSEGMVEAFYLFFPDPWPKRRHHRRRLVTMQFLDSVHRALQSHGTFHIATDQLDYFRQIQGIATAHLAFDEVNGAAASALPATKFERRFREQGVPIYRLSLRKVSPVK